MNDGYDPESRALDIEIAKLAGWITTPIYGCHQLWNHKAEMIGSAQRLEADAWTHVPPFSHSLAKTYALVGEVFPDGKCGVDFCHGEYFGWVDTGTRYEVKNADGAKALALAVKWALETVKGVGKSQIVFPSNLQWERGVTIASHEQIDYAIRVALSESDKQYQIGNQGQLIEVKSL